MKTPLSRPAAMVVAGPACAVVNTPVGVLVTAVDLAGVTVVNDAYRPGTNNDVRFSSSPAGQATLPTPYQFTVAARGTKVLNVTFTSAATRRDRHLHLRARLRTGHGNLGRDRGGLQQPTPRRRSTDDHVRPASAARPRLPRHRLVESASPEVWTSQSF